MDQGGKYQGMVVSSGRQKATVGLLAVSALWLGLLLGVSFLATPVKFHAPSLQLPVALDVGRYTFAAFNKVEWICVVATLALLFGARGRIAMAAMTVAVVVLVAETAWLLPALDQRVGMILAGRQPPPSNLHVAYIAIEIVKLIALLALCGDTVRRLLRAPHR